MSERILIRDSFDGKSKADEDFIIEYINRNFTKIKAKKNPDDRGIDVILYNKQDAIIGYLEVEGTKENRWNDTEKPIWGSRLMTMPIRKIRLFIREHSTLDNYLSIHRTIEIDDFIRLYDLNDKEVILHVIEDLPRFWIKINFTGKYFCICYKNEIVEKINQEYYYPDKRKKNHEGYFRNIWYNELIPRDDKTLLVLGDMDCNKIFFGKFESNDLYRYLKDYFSDIDE